MAVFYKWIKGFEQGATLDKNQWSYITWGKGIEQNGENATVEMMPSLHINYGKDETKQQIKLGYFLTNAMPTPRIEKTWVFEGDIMSVVNSTTAADTGETSTIKRVSEGLQIASYTHPDTNYYPRPIRLWGHENLIGGSSYIGVGITDGGQFIGNMNTTTNSLNPTLWTIKVHHKENNTSLLGSPGLEVWGRTYITTNQTSTQDKKRDEYNMFYVEGGSYIGAEFDSSGPTNNATATFPCYSDAVGDINFYKPLVVKSKPVHALYFNATSDKRAKENIKPATYSALELINKLPVYTYNYKNNNENMTGILAQDLLAAQPKELDLVSNINATGEDNDYMSIKNDKLMFVLLKAIQEQQEEINTLKQRIRQLEEK